MSGGSKPSGTQVVQQSSGPWAGQQPYLQDGFAIARQLLANDAASGGPAFYPGQTYVGPSTWTNNANNTMLARAQNQGAAIGAPAERALGGQAAGLLTYGAAGRPGYGALAETASGGMIGRNPEFTGMVQRAVEAARPGIDSQFAGAGRLGSGAHANAMASAATNLAGNLAYQDYGRERQNQLTAASGLLGTDLQARGLGAQLSGMATGNDRATIDSMFRGGQLAEEYGQRHLEDQINRWNWNQSLPWNQLQRYMGMIQGNYGSEGTSTRPIYGNQGLSTLFGGMSAAGGLASGAGALITALSDARAKEDIRPVGALDNGLTVYSYRYKGDDTPQIGLLAQEVAAARPEAVAVRPSGLLGVNYDLATA